jgi:hypothetical protein
VIAINPYPTSAMRAKGIGRRRAPPPPSLFILVHRQISVTADLIRALRMHRIDDACADSELDLVARAA